MNSIEDKIPKTGRIGRFAKIVKNEVPKELAEVPIQKPGSRNN